MDLFKAMRVFAKVVEVGGFGRAARALDMAPPMVTRTVADLEAHLGVRLLNRTTRSVALSEVGEQYLQQAQAILLDLAESEALAREGTHPPQGQVRLACPPELAAHALVHGLARLAALHPQVGLQVECTGSGVDHCDLALHVGHQPPEGDCVVHRLARSEVVLCATPAYLDGHGRPHQPQELAHHALLIAPLPLALPRRGLVLQGPGGPKGLGDTVEVLPEQPLALATADTGLLHAAALAGLGVAALPSYMLGSSLHTQALEHVLPPWRADRLHVWATTPSRRRVSARTRAVLDFLRQAWGGEDRDPWLAAPLSEPAEPGNAART